MALMPAQTLPLVPLPLHRQKRSIPFRMLTLRTTCFRRAKRAGMQPRPGQRHWKELAGPAFLTAKAIQVKAQHPMPKLFDRSERTDGEHRTGMNECRLRNRP